MKRKKNYEHIYLITGKETFSSDVRRGHKDLQSFQKKSISY
jgi:hypothetical protein